MRDTTVSLAQAGGDVETEGTEVPARTPVRVGLAAMTFSGLLVGVWATTAPESFYRDFPGLGRHWVSIDGPYNEHLLGDVGVLNLALALITAVAAIRLGPTMIRAVCAGWLVYSVPHQLYHALHPSGLETTDFWFEMASLSVNVVIPTAILVVLAIGDHHTRR